MAWYELDLSKHSLANSSDSGDLRWPLAVLGILGCIGLLVVSAAALFLGALPLASWSLVIFAGLAIIVRFLVRD